MTIINVTLNEYAMAYARALRKGISFDELNQIIDKRITHLKSLNPLTDKECKEFREAVIIWYS